MAQTRVPKGTNSSKTSGTALTVSGVQPAAGSTLVVAVAWEDEGQSDKPTIKWGNRELKYVIGSEAQRGDTVVRQYKTRVKVGKAKDVTVTWQNAKTTRCMFVTEITEASKVDAVQINDGPSTLAPGTGAAVQTTVANTIHIAAFAIIGPSTDAVPTANIGHTLGQRVGTSGGGAASNITLIETYEILPASLVNVRSTLTLLTSRAYCANIAAYSAVETYTIASTEHIPWKVTGMSNRVRFNVEDSGNNPVFVVELPTEVFEILTDQQVTDFVRSAALWYTDVAESENDKEDPDIEIETRLGAFDNDTVVI